MNILSLLFFALLFPLNCFSLDTENFLVLEELEYPYSRIIFIEDTISNTSWVLKQIKEEEPEEQIQILMEVLASEIGQEANVSVNEVILFSSNEQNELKPIPGLAATLHQKALGELLEDLEEWQDLVLAQRIRPPQCLEYKKWGPLPSNQTGLSWKVIESMARHQGLSPIVALDTFVGNRDRWGNNLFYDEKTDTFTAIDFGESYKFNLCHEAKKQIQEFNFRYQELKITEEIIYALKLYQRTLHELLQKWPIERVIDRFYELYEISGIIKDENSCHKMEKYFSLMQENFFELKPLLEEIENLITNLENHELFNFEEISNIG